MFAIICRDQCIHGYLQMFRGAICANLNEIIDQCIHGYLQITK